VGKGWPPMTGRPFDDSCPSAGCHDQLPAWGGGSGSWCPTLCGPDDGGPDGGGPDQVGDAGIDLGGWVGVRTPLPPMNGVPLGLGCPTFSGWGVHWWGAPCYGRRMDKRPLPPPPTLTPVEKLGRDVASIKIAVWIIASLMMLTVGWALLIGFAQLA
jgi:hypothetical protein